MAVSGLCLSSYTHFLDVCGDKELTKVTSGMRRDFYSVMPDLKEASTRVSNCFASIARTQMCVY